MINDIRSTVNNKPLNASLPIFTNNLIWTVEYPNTPPSTLTLVIQSAVWTGWTWVGGSWIMTPLPHGTRVRTCTRGVVGKAVGEGLLCAGTTTLLITTA